MALPLPRVIADVEKGGPVLTSMEGGNVFTKGALENKFKPLQMAINAQNSLAYSNRMGNMGMYFKALSQMPAAERQAYLADPENRKNYMNMVEQFRGGINNPQTQGNVLSPEYAQSFFGGQGEGNPLSSLFGMLINKISPSRNALTSQPSMPNQSMPSVPQNEPAPPGTPNEFGEINKATPEEVDQAIARGEGTLNQSPPGEVNVGGETGQIVPEVGTQFPPQNAQVNTPRPLTPQERSTIAAQQQSNKTLAGSVQSARAEGAATMDKFLIDNRPAFSQAFNDANKYQGIYGRGKKWMAMLKKEQPEAYANYIFTRDSLRSNLANQIKFMEHMGATNTQLAHAGEMVVALDKLDESPETARKIANKSIDSLFKLSDSIYQVAEPRFPGTHRKLFGIPEFKGDYLPSYPGESSKKTSNERINVISPDGKLGHISASNWEEAKKAGYKRA